MIDNISRKTYNNKRITVFSEFSLYAEKYQLIKAGFRNEQ